MKPSNPANSSQLYKLQKPTRSSFSEPSLSQASKKTKTKENVSKFEEKFKFKFQPSFIIVDRYLSFNFHLL